MPSYLQNLCNNIKNMADTLSRSTERSHMDDVFKNFHQKYDDSDLDFLCEAYRIPYRINVVALKACTVKYANCQDSVNFAKASVSVEEQLDNWYPIEMVFKTSLRILGTFSSWSFHAGTTFVLVLIFYFLHNCYCYSNDALKSTHLNSISN